MDESLQMAMEAEAEADILRLQLESLLRAKNEVVGRPVPYGGSASDGLRDNWHAEQGRQAASGNIARLISGTRDEIARLDRLAARYRRGR